jgi:putative FmdB family regulatory protein
MPTYSYRCDECGIEFDQYQKFTDISLTHCPDCGKKSLRKIFQPVCIVFKGSGFYATDHKSPSGVSATSKTSEKSSETPKTETTSPASESSSSVTAESKATTVPEK